MVGYYITMILSISAKKSGILYKELN